MHTINDLVPNREHLPEKRNMQLGSYLLQIYPHQRTLLMKSEQNGERVLRLTRTDIELLTILSSQEIIPDSHLYAHLQINRSRLKDKKCLERHIENLRIKLRGFAIISRVQGYGYALLAIEETSDAVSA